MKRRMIALRLDWRETTRRIQAAVTSVVRSLLKGFFLLQWRGGVLDVRLQRLKIDSRPRSKSLMYSSARHAAPLMRSVGRLAEIGDSPPPKTVWHPVLNQCRDPIMRIENGRYSAGEYHERWGLAGSGFSRKRIFTDKIYFSQPFENPPKVLIAISGFDISDSGESFRSSLDVQAAHITVEGFTVQFNAYESSRLRSLTVDWLAVGT